jgi:hypothetical protein
MMETVTGVLWAAVIAVNLLGMGMAIRECVLVYRKRKRPNA